MKKYFKKLGIEVIFTTGQNPCISIKNSYRVRGRAEIKSALACIRNMPEYKTLLAAGYNRTAASEYSEWRAHNILYQLGYERDRTGSVDIAQNESKLRRIAYAVLSIF